MVRAVVSSAHYAGMKSENNIRVAGSSPVLLHNMKSIKFLLFLCIGMMLLTTVSCSNDNGQKETNTTSFSREGDYFVLTYLDENDKAVEKYFTWDKYNVGLQELEATQSLFQQDEVRAGDSNGTARILCSIAIHNSDGVYYVGYLIDDVTKKKMFFYYYPMQMQPRTGIIMPRRFSQCEVAPGDGC